HVAQGRSWGRGGGRWVLIRVRKHVLTLTSIMRLAASTPRAEELQHLVGVLRTAAECGRPKAVLSKHAWRRTCRFQPRRRPRHRSGVILAAGLVVESRWHHR